MVVIRAAVRGEQVLSAGVKLRAAGDRCLTCALSAAQVKRIADADDRALLAELDLQRHQLFGGKSRGKLTKANDQRYVLDAPVSLINQGPHRKIALDARS
jgi:hypothetical protein